MRKRNNFSNDFHGFTLVELLILVGIIVIALSQSSSVIEETRNQADNREGARLFFEALEQTRLEAISRSKNVTISTPLNSPQINSLFNWANGWDIFIDVDGSGDFNNGDNLLFSQGNVPEVTILHGNQQASLLRPNQITYTPQGNIRPFNLLARAQGHFRICSLDGTIGRAIVINSVGRPRLTLMTNSDPEMPGGPIQPTPQNCRNN